MLQIVLASLVAQAISFAPDAGADGGDRADSEEGARGRQTVVTASRTETRLEDVVIATEVVNRARLEAHGARDLTQLMQQHPGVEVVYTNRGVGLRLQGLDPEYVLVLVDGQRVAGRAGSMTDLSRFSLRDVERVEVIKGPAAALYGADAIGGVIHLITRRPTKPLEVSLRAGFGTLTEGDVRGHVGSKLGPFEVRAGGGYRTRSAFDWSPSDVANSGPALRRIDADAELGWAASEALRAWVRGSYVLTDLAAVDLNDTGAVFDRFQRTEQLDVALGARGRIAPATNVSGRAHFGLFRDQFLVDQRGARALDEYSVNRTRLWEAMVQLDHSWWAHVSTFGVETLFEALNSTRIEPGQVARSRVAGFVQDTWSTRGPGPRVAIEPGFRFDVDSHFGGASSPRVAVKVDPMPSLTFRASWGTGFRPPSFSELFLRFSNAGIGYVVQGNPALKPERSNAVNLSVDYRLPREGWGISMAAWHASQTNLINITADAPPNPDAPAAFSYENVASAFTQGVELTGRARVARGASCELSYVALDAWDVTRRRPLEGRSAHKLTGQVASKFRPLGLEVVLRASWSSARPFYSGTGLGLANVLGYGAERVILAPAYFDLEAQLTWKHRHWLQLFVNGYNLLNTGDQQFNPRPPRGVLAGVQVDY